MEFDKSALLGLKAELLRKREEVENAKRTNQAFKRPPKILTKTAESNAGVEERDRLDALEAEVPVDALEKSKKMLEAKSKLYEQLTSNKLNTDNPNFLVDFNSKCQDEKNNDFDSDSDSDWVDFVDCLGRTRRCLKEDLDEMMKKDSELRAGEKTQVNNNILPVSSDNVGTAFDSELLSADMQRELLRQKWEEKEQELLGSRDVHYQDVLFDEARQHGVAYYAFSTNESERKRQQDDLRKLRLQTEEEKEAHLVAEKSKKRQMKERLRAARRRKRERLGLPPEDDVDTDEEKEDISQPQNIAETVETPERNVRKPTTVREWDVGKEDPSRILSQEEWVSKKRAERLNEFAPPSSLPTNTIKKAKYTTPATEVRRAFKNSSSLSSASLPKEYLHDLYSSPPPLYTHPDVSSSKMESPVCAPRKIGVEIPPPSCLADGLHLNINKSDIEKSIDEGLQYLRQQAEKKGHRLPDESDFLN